MNKFFSALDKWVALIIENMVGVSMIILTLIVFFQVLARYVFKVSLDGLQELPTFLMIISVWLSAAVGTRKEGGHIKLDLVDLVIKNKKINRVIQLLVSTLTVAAAAVFTYLCFDYVNYGMESGEVSIGLKLPMWSLSSVLLVSGILMTVYNIINVYRGVKEIGKC